MNHEATKNTKKRMMNQFSFQNFVTFVPLWLTS